jgi:hypothetical protein
MTVANNDQYYRLSFLIMYITTVVHLFLYHCNFTFAVHHTTSCIAQSNAPDDGQNCCPKHVELIWIYQQTLTVASSWFSSLPSILMMHGQTNTKFNTIVTGRTDSTICTTQHISQTNIKEWPA